jgi:saccharopine dehydrogenase (NAD+, L-lysine-forming)
MAPLKIGILREGKIPPDNRTPLKPRQCRELMERFPELEIKVEWTAYRCCPDEDYKKFGINVVENVSDCDLLLGIKEVPVDKLIAGKTYMFFSHTSKKQPHNAGLLHVILEKGITLIDYEMLTDDQGNRLIGFGRWAGIVGAHYALLMIGKRRKLYNLKPASQCVNLQEVLDQYENIQFPATKFVITGDGRVAHGALEVMDFAKITRVSKEEFLEKEFPYPVYTQLHSSDLYKKPGVDAFDKTDFHLHPEAYINCFLPFTEIADVLINCIFWHPKAPRLFQAEDIEKTGFKMKIIADVSCDVNGSVPITFRESIIADPVYGVHVYDKRICKPYEEDTIDVMAVSNLPNELPLDASRDFGKILMDIVIPKYLYTHEYPLFERATIVREGKLTPRYAYLQDYAEGK